MKRLFGFLLTAAIAMAAENYTCPQLPEGEAQAVFEAHARLYADLEVKPIQTSEQARELWEHAAGSVRAFGCWMESAVRRTDDLLLENDARHRAVTGGAEITKVEADRQRAALAYALATPGGPQFAARFEELSESGRQLKQEIDSIQKLYARRRMELSQYEPLLRLLTWRRWYAQQSAESALSLVVVFDSRAAREDLATVHETAIQQLEGTLGETRIAGDAGQVIRNLPEWPASGTALRLGSDSDLRKAIKAAEKKLEVSHVR